ncbi:hypothetical protein BDV59DRAFT_134816 [Aspergillus ambiguus]|uniref:uncharacterized protein n=1 Tax=Aspergillus ambiguus TaxID=176160 RepID=UPI003CCD0004
MAELTVGYISGIIAAAVFLVRLFFPTASALILVGFLQDTETASTCSCTRPTVLTVANNPWK